MKRKFVIVEQYQHQYHMRVSTYVILINYLTVIIYLFIFNSYKHLVFCFFWLNENLVKVIFLPLNVFQNNNNNNNNHSLTSTLLINYA